MDFGRLRTLRELWKRGTMSAVADATHVSASAVSQQISQLEAEAGVPLIERRGRGVRLTEAGERLAMHAETIMAVLEEARTDFAEMKKAVGGELRIAAFPSIASSIIPQAMVDLQAAHPKLNIVLETLEAEEGLAALRAWQTDIALIDDLTLAAGGDGHGFDTLYLCDDRLFAMLPAGHRLADRAHVQVADLRDEHWALDVANNRYTDVIMAMCRQEGLVPIVNGHCEGFEVVTALIHAGCSISIMPGLRLQGYYGDVVARPLFPEIRRRISAAVRKGETRNPAISECLKTLQSVAGRVTEMSRIAR